MGNLLVGAAMRKITPSPEMLEEMSKVTGGPSHPYKGVHEDIYARVIVVSDGKEKVVLAGADAGSFPNSDATAKRLNEQFGIDPLACIFSATHNHEAPGARLIEGGDKNFENFAAPSEASDKYAKWVIDQYAEATGEAIEKFQPARMGAIKGESWINVCRDLPTPVGAMQMNNFKDNKEHDLLVIKFESLDGEPIAVYINHATHSNYMVWNLYDQSYPMINNDVGGGISRFVEKAHKNQIVAIWAKGAAGDQNPITRSSWRIVDVNDDGEFSLEQVVFDYKDNLAQLQSLCSTQGLEVLDLMDKIEDWTDEFSFKSAETYRSIPAKQRYSSLYRRGSGTPQDVGKPGQTFSSFGVTLACGERPDPVPFDPPRTIDFRFRLANLCGISFTNLNNESYSGLGKIIKNLMPTKYTAVQCVTWGGMGYINDATIEWINGFGTSGSCAWSGAATEEAYTDGFTELRKEVFGE